MKKAYQNLQDAHPFMKMVTSGVESGIQAIRSINTTAPSQVIEPTDVGVLTFPESALASAVEGDYLLDIEFAYGKEDSAERPIGRARAKPGSALAFVNLDRDVHINNQASICEEGSGESDPAKAGNEWTQSNYTWDGEGYPALSRPVPSSSSRSTRGGKNAADVSLRRQLQFAFDDALSSGELARAIAALSTGVRHGSQPRVDTRRSADPGNIEYTSCRASASSTSAAAPAASSITELERADASDFLGSAAGPVQTAHENERKLQESSADDVQGAPPVDSTSVDQLEAQSSNDSSSDLQMSCQTIEIVNCDFAPVTIKFYRSVRGLSNMFEKAVHTATVEAGETQSVSLPRTSVAVAHSGSNGSANADTNTVADPIVADEDTLFEIEVQGNAGKTFCNARLGQIITYEGGL